MNNLYGMIILSVSLFAIVSCNHSQDFEKSNIKNITRDAEKERIFKILQSKDSLLFEQSFNNCDTSVLRILLNKDFEFYHDQSGITDSRDAFVQSIANGLCKLEYKATRELVPNSLQVHLLRNNGVIYGAIQKGEHSFYSQVENEPKIMTSTAEFTHLWILEEGDWTLKRVLSYNHH